jgi:hypothetical protein
MSQRHMELGDKPRPWRSADRPPAGPVEYRGQGARDRVARRVGTGGREDLPPARVAQRANTHPRDLRPVIDHRPSQRRTGPPARRPRDTAANSRKTSISSRVTSTCAPWSVPPPPANARSSKRLKRRGAGPVFRAGDPLQGGGEKAQLRVAFDLGKAVAVDAQDVPKSSVARPFRPPRPRVPPAPPAPGRGGAAVPARVSASIPISARAARARARSNLGSSFEGSSTKGTRSVRTWWRRSARRSFSSGRIT